MTPDDAVADLARAFVIVAADADSVTILAKAPIVVFEPDRAWRLQAGQTVVADYGCKVVRAPGPRSE